MSYHHHSNNTHQWNQRQQQIEQPWQQPPFNISPQPWKQPRFNSKPHNPSPIYNRPTSMGTRITSSGQQTLRSPLEQSLIGVQQTLDEVKHSLRQLLDKLPPRHQQAEIQPMKSAFSTPTEPSYTTLDLKTIKERKAAGLCEYCELKFFSGHKCKSSQLFLIVLGDEEQDPSEYGLLDEGVEKEQKEMGNLCVEKDEDKQKVEDDEKKQKVDDSIFHHLEGAVDCVIKEEEILVNCATREEVLAPVEQRSWYNLLELLSFVLRPQLKSNLLQIEPLSSGEQNQRLHHVEVSPRLPQEQQRVMPKMDEEHLGFVIPIPTESASKNMSENSQANFEIMLLTTAKRKIEKAKLLRKDYKEKYKDEL